MNNKEFETKKSLNNKKKLKKILKIFIPCCIVLVVIFFIWPSKKNDKGFSTSKVKKEIIKNQIQVSGYIEAAQRQQLQAPGEGIVKIVNVKEGDYIKKGSLIFALDTAYQEMQVAKQQFAIAQEEINGASKRLNLMKKELELLTKQLHDRSVYAKFDGIIASLNLMEGIYAKPKDYFGTVIDRSYLKATIGISETDASRLALNQKVLLTFQALPGQEFTAKVVGYPSIANLNQQRGVIVIDAKIRMDNPSEKILPGYSFSGKIIVGDDEEVLLVEQSAISYNQGVPFVERINSDGSTEKINVEIQPYMHGFIKIVSGLNEGDVLKNNESNRMGW